MVGAIVFVGGCDSFFGVPALAAPTRFTSSNYGVESIIFGGTGLLHSSNDSIPPVILSGPTVGGVTTSSATISWKTDKSATALVQAGTTSGVYTVQNSTLNDATQTDHAITLSSLAKGATYYYRVQSADVAGNTVQSAELTFATDPGDVTPPAVTKGPSLTINSATSIIVTWETDELSSSVVEYGVAKINENAVGHADELTLFHQVTVNGLQPSQNYIWRIKSQDASGNLTVGSAQALTTLSAPSITEVKITDITLNSALLQWKTTSPSTSQVKYGTESGAYDQTVEDTSFTQAHLVRLANLKSGTTFYLRISGVDQSGNRLQSDEYLFKTVVLPIITDFKADAVTSSGAQLTWQSSSDIDELVRFQISKSDDKKLIGKLGSGGNDQLVSSHLFKMQDLESSATYRVSVVGKDVFGNQALSQEIEFTTLPDRDPPVIQNIKSDTSVDLGSKETVQVLVSFGLSEPSTAYIEYGIGATGTDGLTKIDTDPETTQNKFMVIPNLQPGQSYHFHIIAHDRAGNQATSADYLVLAPAKSVSLLDLIFGQVRDNFGWLGKLGGGK